MPNARASGPLLIVLLFLVTAGLLRWSYRGGTTRLWSVCTALACLLIFLFVKGQGGQPTDWPLWGTSLVILLVALGMAFAVSFVASQRINAMGQVLIVAAVGGVLYIVLSVLLLFVFPGRFWI